MLHPSQLQFAVVSVPDLLDQDLALAVAARIGIAVASSVCCAWPFSSEGMLAHRAASDSRVTLDRRVLVSTYTSTIDYKL